MSISKAVTGNLLLTVDTFIASHVRTRTLPSARWPVLVLSLLVIFWFVPQTVAAAPAAAMRATSSTSLRFSRSAVARSSFLPIRSSAHVAPKVLYSVRLAANQRPSTATVRGLMQVTYCRSTDLAGTNKPSHPCVGTRPYSYEPRVDAKLILAATPYAIAGRVIQPWRGMVCHKVLHHCPLTVEANRVAVSGGAANYVNLVASAHSSGASGGQILAIDRTTGGLQVIQSLGRPAASRTLTSGPRLASFPVSPGGVQATRESQRPAVIFSQPVTVRAGQVLDVSSAFTLTIHNSNDNAPLARAWVVLAPTATAPYLRPGLPVTARGGQNCPTTCTLTRVAALRSPFSGRRYVNVGVLLKDHSGETSATATYSGVLRVTRR